MRTRDLIQIEFRKSETPFQPANGPTDWIDTSFSQSEKAIGYLRLPGVSNGRYEEKHPILNAQGDTEGFLVNGRGLLGYTFECVYAGGCLWIANQGFNDVLDGADRSEISLVEETGMFLFSPGSTKFEAVKFFSFGAYWVNNIRAFKVLDNDNYLLYLTTYGVCLFDTRERDIVSRADFTKFAHQWSGFALSPGKLLAIGCSMRINNDPLFGSFRHRNFVQIYNLETGELVGEHDLPVDVETQWSVDFSEDGRQLKVASESSTHSFDLIPIK